MLRAGLGIKEKREMFRGLIGLYTGGFLLGGVFTFLHQYVRTGSLFFGIAVLSYHGVQGIWSFITCLQRFLSYRCKVTLSFESGECTVDAIIDTGNCLRDPLTDHPVCVLEESKVKAYISDEKLAKLRRIPFCSVGQSDGRIPVIEIEKMCIHKEKEYRISHPVIGICGERISGKGAALRRKCAWYSLPSLLCSCTKNFLDKLVYFFASHVLALLYEKCSKQHINHKQSLD